MGLFDRFGKPAPAPRDGGRYFLAASCDSLVTNSRTLANVIAALALLRHGASLGGATAAATELGEMIEALEDVQKNILRVAKDYDPREGVYRPIEYVK